MKHRAAACRIRFFSPEKIFRVNVKINGNNDRWLCRGSEYVPVIGTTKFLAGFHVLVVISSEEQVTPPHFSGRGRNVLKEAHLDVRKAAVKQCMVEAAARKPWLYQKDRGPAHMSNWVQTV